VFGTGWGRRVAEVKAAALAMVDKPERRAPDGPTLPARGKGAVALNSRARHTTAGGALVAGGAAAAQSSETSTIVIIVAVALAFAVGTWLFWRWRQRQQQEVAA